MLLELKFPHCGTIMHFLFYSNNSGENAIVPTPFCVAPPLGDTFFPDGRD